MAVEGGGIGARLRAGREKMGLTVLQVAERIHTDPKIVEAIEVDNFSVLGAPVYARGHIRHYAELVGESANDLITAYAHSSKVGQPDLTQIVKAPSAGDTNRLVAPALVVITVFAVAGAIWWVSALSKKKPQMSESHVVGQEPSGPAPSGRAPQAAPLPGADAVAGAGADVGASPPASTQTTVPPASVPRSGALPTGSVPGGGSPRVIPAPGAGQPRLPAQPSSRASPPQAQNNFANGAASSPPRPTPAGASSTTSLTRMASAATNSRSASAGSTTVAASSIPMPRSKDQSQVTLRYSADSWTEVYDATGARLFYDVGSANSVQTVYGTPPLRVVLGNASGVAVEFNGRSTPIATLAHPDGSVQFSINRSGHVVRAKPVPDGG